MIPVLIMTTAFYSILDVRKRAFYVKVAVQYLLLPESWDEGVQDGG
jgi:hypothetical protein